MQALDLGAEHRTSLHLPDGEVAHHEAEVVRRVTAMLRLADVIVSPWRFDGHPDHDACGRAAAGVRANTGCALWEAPIWMRHWARLNDVRVPWLRMQSLAVSNAARASKHAALAAHVSQLTPRGDGLGAVLDGAIVVRAARHAEYFFVEAVPNRTTPGSINSQRKSMSNMTASTRSTAEFFSTTCFVMTPISGASNRLGMKRASAR